MSSLLTLLSLAEARENDENFKSALDLMFLQIEEGKKYKQNDGSSPDTAGNAGLSRSFGTKQAITAGLGCPVSSSATPTA